jgi:hypothetical protein
MFGPIETLIYIPKRFAGDHGMTAEGAQESAFARTGNSAICHHAGASDRKLCVPASRRVCPLLGKQ